MRSYVRALEVIAAMQAAMIASQADSRNLDKTRAKAASSKVVSAQAQAAMSPPPTTDTNEASSKAVSAQVQVAMSTPSTTDADEAPTDTSTTCVEFDL